SGTDDTVNFIGTTDNSDAVFKTNNLENLRIKSDGRVEMGNRGINHGYAYAAASSNPKLIVASEDFNNNIYFQATNNSNDATSLYFAKSRGNNTSPT
ncbi:MAG: hypothetical protein NWP87_00790, partial [Winogradskyella sp.]|nr:hypothetical protein [Winogradskyella sp.]